MMRRVSVLSLVLVSFSQAAAPPPVLPAYLNLEQWTQLETLKMAIDFASYSGKFEEAIESAQELANHLERWRGKRHPEAAEARAEVEYWQRLLKLPERKRAEVAESRWLLQQGVQLLGGRRIRQAEGKLRQALALTVKALGERHRQTALCYNSLAVCLGDLGKEPEAFGLHQKALEINKDALGELHSLTALTYYNLAGCYSRQGRAAEALLLHHKALDITRRIHGEQHPDTADSYKSLALCLELQGKATEALPLYRKARDICETVSGELHVETATKYVELAGCLQTLGRTSEALPLHRKALDIRIRFFGDKHPATATSYNNLAACLIMQGRYAEAVPLLRRSLAGGRDDGTDLGHAPVYSNLAVCLDHLGNRAEALQYHRKSLELVTKINGEHHPDTVRVMSNLAGCLGRQGRESEAVPLLEKALEIRVKSLGEKHPHTAMLCHNLASSLMNQGDTTRVLPLYQKALAINKEVLGDLHPDTAMQYTNAANLFHRQKNYAKAADYFGRALAGHEASRLSASDSGFGRSQFRADFLSPRAGLASCEVQLGHPSPAWRHAESDFARGLLDDLLLGAKPANDADRLARLRWLDQALVPLLTAAKLDGAAAKRRDEFTKQRDDILAELTAESVRRSSDRVLPLADVQRQLPPDAAIVFWLDFLDQHLGCVLRRKGDPQWAKLPGSGDKDAWTPKDDSLPERAYLALVDPSSDEASRRQLAAALHRQRLAPLRPHLDGVKRLLVIPAGGMAAVPVAALTDDYVVANIPSASVYARLMAEHRPLSATTLLALADPVLTAKTPEPPSHGLLLVTVMPGGSAARAGLRSGDVLLEVNGKRLDTLDDLKPGLASLPAAARVWRDGGTVDARFAAATLGVQIARGGIGEALAAWRKSNTLVALRSKPWQALPGTRLEVQALSRLIPKHTTLVGSAASEQNLDALTDKLSSFRVLHLATHGEANELKPAETALILAQDRLPTRLDDEVAAVLADKKPLDGRLTVGTILKNWKLDADLVVLSACESGLGKHTSGDGMLGFAQALLQKGARSVVLSRWKVDDAATALLMTRFYENLLGQREGLKSPLGRADALHEAKRWLRGLPRPDAEKRLGRLLDGLAVEQRGPVKTALKLTKSQTTTDQQPFAHPYYWAAFVLIGDPD